MRSMKSLLGSSLIDGSTEVQGRSIPFRVLLTRFIAELKRRAETAAGRDFQRVVLGRPVFFVDDDPAADQTAQDTLGEIARQVGFTDIEFQFEPLARLSTMNRRSTARSWCWSSTSAAAPPTSR